MKKNKAGMIDLAHDLIIEEVLTEGAKPYADLLNKLRKARPGSQKYQDLAAELGTAASVLTAKAREAESTVDEYIESLPDDD